MRRPRVYVDNSVFSGTQDEEFAEESLRFFERVHEGAYAVLVSEAVLRELARAPEGARRVHADLPAGSVEEVPVDDEVNELAQAYIDAGVLGSRRIAPRDARCRGDRSARRPHSELELQASCQLQPHPQVQRCKRAQGVRAD